MRYYRPCWIGRLRESCEKRPIPRPLPKWEGVPAGEGQSAAGVTVRYGGGVVRFAAVRGCDDYVVARR